MKRLHDLAALPAEKDGELYRHELVSEDASTAPSVTCAECDGTATYRFEGRPTVQSCRGLVLCRADKCELGHLFRHSRAIQDERDRVLAAESAGRRAAIRETARPAA